MSRKKKQIIIVNDLDIAFVWLDVINCIIRFYLITRTRYSLLSYHRLMIPAHIMKYESCVLHCVSDKFLFYFIYNYEIEILINKNSTFQIFCVP